RLVTSGDMMVSIVDEIRSSPIVRARVFAFIAKITALHLAFGVVAWGLSRLSVAAFPWLARNAYGVVVGWSVALTFLVGIVNGARFPWSRTGKWSRTVEDFLSLPLPLWPFVAA